MDHSVTNTNAALPSFQANNAIGHQHSTNLGAQTQNDYESLVNSIQDYGIFMTDPTGSIVSCNKAMERISGHSTLEVIGRHFSLFYPTEDTSNGLPQAQQLRALQSGRFEDEGWCVKKDGTRRWSHIYIAPFKNDQGSLRGFGHVIRNLTERRLPQERYRLIVESIGEYAIFMIDPSGVIQSWNHGAERIKGYSANEVINTHFSRFYTKEDRDRGHPAKELNLAAKNGKYEEEGWRVRKDGSTFWANVVITALRNENGKLIGFAKVTRDLTERKKAEEALRSSEERFRLLVDSVKDYAILMLDAQGCVMNWNAGAERIKGWRPDEIIGRHFSVFYLPEDIKADKPRFELESAIRLGRFEDFGWRVRKDGSKFWANVIITPLRDERGTLRGFAKVTRDITERKKAEEELQLAYQELEKRVEDRTQALLVANRELESFSYSVSHDLRAPLRSMDGFSQALLKYYADNLDDRGKDYLRRIRDSSQRMGTLIEDILNLSKLGRTNLRRDTVDLSEIASNIAAELKKAEPSRDVNFKITPGLLAVCDANLMRIVLENLMGNSWKYTSYHAKAEIIFGASTAKDQIVYFIQDDGAGFDMAYADKLFGAFQRLHSDAEFRGTGIGLASVKRIIQRHGGEVWAQGAIEKGSTFYFTLQPSSRIP